MMMDEPPEPPDVADAAAPPEGRLPFLAAVRRIVDQATINAFALTGDRTEASLV